MQIAPLIARLTPEALAALPEHRQAVLRYLWPAFARPPQIPPESDHETSRVAGYRAFNDAVCGDCVRPLRRLRHDDHSRRAAGTGLLGDGARAEVRGLQREALGGLHWRAGPS